MSPQEADIIDLTTPSSPTEYIVVDSDTEVAPVAANGKPTRKEKRRRQRQRKRNSNYLEEGEIPESTSTVEVSMEGPSERNGGNAGRAAVANGKQWPSKESVSPRTGKSLLDRLSSPNRHVRNGSRREARREKVGDRKREQSPQRERAEDTSRRRRSRSPRPLRGEKENSRTVADEEMTTLFFIDVQKADIPDPVQLPVPGSSTAEKVVEEVANPVLLLPAHVSVFGEDGVDPVEILPPSTENSDDESYIEYLDYDDDRRAPGMVRYFEKVDEEEKPAKPKTIVCKNCGAEGQHKTFECPVLICLTCGARDEHSTRSCPISKTCFSCGMKGHINRTCPNRFSRRGGVNQYDDCDRCGSQTHTTNECPTLWRIYDYLDDAERQITLNSREDKRTLALGNGGEGYIASDDWCYNCGACGHLGDDCGDLPHAPDAPREPSAFGSYNLLSGPFADTSVRPSSRSNKKRAPRDWEVAGEFADGFGSSLPMDVGKQGRRKERARMEKHARAMEEAEDDPDDWFGSRGKGRSGGDRHSGGRGDNKAHSSNRNGKTISIGLSSGRNTGRDDGRYGDGRKRVVYDDLPGPSRETDSIQVRGASGRRYDNRDGGGRYDRDDSRRRREDRGPRYKGGYSR